MINIETLTRWAFCSAAVSVLSISASTSASAIGTSTTHYEVRYTGAGPAGEVDLYPAFAADLVGGPVYHPFDRLKVSASSVGNENSVDASAPEFAEAAVLLTNGLDNQVGAHGDGNLWTTYQAESAGLSGPGFGGTDFAGCTIEQITIHWDYYFSGYVEGGEVLTEFTYTTTYFGILPEPATLGLLACSVLAMGRGKR